MPQRSVLLGALAVWLLAMIGALGVAYWLQLSQRDSIGLVLIVAGISFLGTFIPIFRLGRDQKS